MHFRLRFLLLAVTFSVPSLSFANGNIKGRVTDSGPAFGVGVHASLAGSDIRVDYALRTAQFFGNNHVFSFVLGL